MNKLIKTFSNLQLSIFLLLIIASLSAIGSIIEQDKSIEFYKSIYNALYLQVPLWVLLYKLGFTKVYTSWWFLMLLFLLGFCLLSCTFSRQLPILKFAKRYYFYNYPNQLKKFNQKFKVQIIDKTYLCYQLISMNYSICQNNIGFYCYKGLIGKIGPVVVHLSIICILIGSVLSATKGFTSQELIPKSEIFHIQNLVKIGDFAKISQQTFRVNDFWINFDKSGRVKQFQSDISILVNNGNEIKRKTISVNNPLIFKEFTLYQTDWSVIGLRLKFINQNLVTELPLSKLINKNDSKNFWISWFPSKTPHTNKKTGVIVILNDIYNEIEFYNQKAQLLNSVNLNETLLINNEFGIKVLDNILSTGIQIKSDPGTKIIYVGFVILIISSVISYISFSEIWYLEYQKNGFCAGRTNRDKVKFNSEIVKIKKPFLLKQNNKMDY
jgi:cytochrome c biogenesis protein